MKIIDDYIKVMHDDWSCDYCFRYCYQSFCITRICEIISYNMLLRGEY